MVEFRWVGRELQFRQRSFHLDASGAFCGVTEFSSWESVPEMEAGEQDIFERDSAESAADKLASLILNESIGWPDHSDAWHRAVEKCRAIG